MSKPMTFNLQKRYFGCLTKNPRSFFELRLPNAMHGSGFIDCNQTIKYRFILDQSVGFPEMVVEPS